MVMKMSYLWQTHIVRLLYWPACVEANSTDRQVDQRMGLLIVVVGNIVRLIITKFFIACNPFLASCYCCSTTTTTNLEFYHYLQSSLKVFSLISYVYIYKAI